MKTKTSAIIGFLTASTLALSAQDAKDNPPVDPKPGENKVQIVLLLDTSNSMDGLIDQAKTQLWKVVNTFIDAKRNGAVPFVEVALYEYGNNDQHVGNHYIRQVQPLTRDLDEVSKQMFALRTNGGEEYAGAVIQRALADLAWDGNPKTYKVVFIAGNEPFTQGPVDVRQACRDAVAKGIVVNTIHCGSRQEGISGSWHDGAALAGGEFMVIDQDSAVRHIPAPQDKKISDLGVELNKTYLGYGKLRAEGMEKQTLSDSDAEANRDSGALVQRAICKSSANYSNSAWDLVDAVRENKVDPAKLDASELPKELQSLTADQLKTRIEEAAKHRAALQAQIDTLNMERVAYVEAELAKQSGRDVKTLDEVMVETTRKQASALGYRFEK